MNDPVADLRSRFIGLRPPRIALSLALLGAAGHWLLPVILWQAPAWAALAVAATGFLVMLRAWWLFRQAGTPICPTDDAAVLITTDVYALSRNPMYLGILAMLGGAALLAGTLPLYLAALAFGAIIDGAFCPYEERRLLAAFGAEYDCYRARVRRWL